jgi:hypothetical protein
MKAIASGVMTPRTVVDVSAEVVVFGRGGAFFIVGVFFVGVFFVGVFFAGVFFVGVFVEGDFLTGVFFAGIAPKVVALRSVSRTSCRS